MTDLLRSLSLCNAMGDVIRQMVGDLVDDGVDAGMICNAISVSLGEALARTIPGTPHGNDPEGFLDKMDRNVRFAANEFSRHLMIEEGTIDENDSPEEALLKIFNPDNFSDDEVIKTDSDFDGLPPELQDIIRGIAQSLGAKSIRVA